MRQKRQIGLWLEPSTCALMEELAAGKHMNTLVEELIQQEAARRKGEIVELNTLPVVREIVQGELLKALSQLRTELREDEQRELQALKQDLLRDMKDSERRSGDRIVGLVIRVLREALITRRMLYALIARQDPRLAEAAFEDAKAKAGRDIAAKASEGAA